MRGQQYRSAIRSVVATFGDGAQDFIFLGSCVLGLYRRPSGGTFRQTIDADVVSTVTPWSKQQKRLADMCTRGVLDPDERITCRYHIRGENIAVDVLSPEGKNVGNITPWFLRSIAHPETFALEDGVRVRAVAPPYFLALKLEAWADRGEDPMTDKDAEDIVAVATEVLDLAESVHRQGIREGIRDLWEDALENHDLNIGDIPEIVRCHHHPIDAAEEDRVVETLTRCARGA